MNIAAIREGIHYHDLIDYIWILENDGPPVHLLVPPNPYPTILISLGSQYLLNKSLARDIMYIRGASLASTDYWINTNTKLIGIRFQPYGIFPFLRSNPTDEWHVANQLKQVGSNADITETIGKYLDKIFDLQRYNRISMVKESLDFFKNRNEPNAVGAYLADRQTSYTTLRSHYMAVLGITPKRFERLIRFRKSLCNLIDTKISLAAVGYDAGYFDQSHFIRDFKAFMVKSPGDFKSHITNSNRPYLIDYNSRVF